MKNHIIILVLAVIYPNRIIAGEAETSFGIDMEALHKFTQEDGERARKETEEREGPDKRWMLEVLKKIHYGEQVSDEEVRRAWEIYRAEKNHKIEDKLNAFRVIAEVEDISKWQQEFDALAYSEDPNFVKIAIQTLFWKLGRGNEREKIILSNKTAVLEHLVQFAEDNKSDTTIDRETSKLLELTKPYFGKTPPAEVQRPDRRPAGSPVEMTSETNRKNTYSSKVGLFLQRIGNGWGLTFAGMIGIIIAAILIWRKKSK